MQRKSIVFFYIPVSSLRLQQGTLSKREKKVRKARSIGDNGIRCCTKDAMVVENVFGKSVSEECGARLVLLLPKSPELLFIKLDHMLW